MAMRLSISEILNKMAELKTKNEKIDWLKKHESVPLKTVLRLIYDDSIEFLVPNTPPPWKKNSYVGVEGMLYKETRRLRIFVKGGGYDSLNQVKREALFISLLEDIDNGDADLLANHMISHTAVKGLTRKTLEEVFPTLFKDQIQLV